MKKQQPKKRNYRQPKIMDQDGKKVAWCPDCNEYRPIEEFGNYPARGIPSYCKVHKNGRQAVFNLGYYEKHKKEMRATQEKYRIKKRKEREDAEKKSKRTSKTLSHDNSRTL